MGGLDETMCEACKYLKATQGRLQETEYENIYLNKQYIKDFEFNYPIMLVTFDNALKEVKFFHPEVNI